MASDVTPILFILFIALLILGITAFFAIDEMLFGDP